MSGRVVSLSLLSSSFPVVSDDCASLLSSSSLVRFISASVYPSTKPVILVDEHDNEKMYMVMQGTTTNMVIPLVRKVYIGPSECYAGPHRVSVFNMYICSELMEGGGGFSLTNK